MTPRVSVARSAASLSLYFVEVFLRTHDDFPALSGDPTLCQQSVANFLTRTFVSPSNSLSIRSSEHRHGPCVNLFMARAKRKPNSKKLEGKPILLVKGKPSLNETLIDLLRRYRRAVLASSPSEKKAPR
jgi:hypothetical protein